MAQRLYRLFVRPVVFFVIALVVVVGLILIVGNLLLNVYEPDFTSELARPELWVATGLALAIIFVGGFFASRPSGSLGILDHPIVVGSKSMFAPVPAGGHGRIDARVRRGQPGTLDDIREGYVLYAQNGPLARVLAVLPGQEEYGRRRRGLIYASGLYGASSELWIPLEAVYAVYPETSAAMLAAKGDETEHFGWNRPPESFLRGGTRPHQPPSSF
jgi:hypothetical protein